MVQIGSVLIILFLMVGLWIMLSSTKLFSKIGKVAIRGQEKFKEKASEEMKNEN